MSFKVSKAGLMLAALTLMFSGMAKAEEALSIGYDEADPPLMYGSAGEAKGVYPDLITAVFAKMATPIKNFTSPWPRVLAGADAGTNGVGGIYKNAAREAKYDYSNAIFEEELAIYTPTDKKFDYKTIDDLSGKTIGVIRGWSYGDDFDKAKAAGKIKIEEVESDQLNIKKLGMGRVDAFIGIPVSVDDEVKKAGFDGKIAKLAAPLSKSPTYLVFAKTAKKTDVLKKFNETLDAMKADGSYDKQIKTSLAK